MQSCEATYSHFTLRVPIQLFLVAHCQQQTCEYH